jgi:predicted nucleic acid-binding protein
LRQLLLEGNDPVVTSEIALVELTSAVARAEQAGRVRHAEALHRRIDADCGRDGPIALLSLRPEVVLPNARGLVRSHGLHALDAIHLAVATQEAAALDPEGLVLVTRDECQAAAATAMGIALL